MAQRIDQGRLIGVLSACGRPSAVWFSPCRCRGNLHAAGVVIDRLRRAQILGRCPRTGIWQLTSIKLVLASPVYLGCLDASIAAATRTSSALSLARRPSGNTTA